MDNSINATRISSSVEGTESSNPLTPPKQRKVREPKGRKIQQRQILEPNEKFYLNMWLLGQQKLSQMRNNNAIGRLKGKKSAEEYHQTTEIIRILQQNFETNLQAITSRHEATLKICIVNHQVLHDLMRLFGGLSFIERKNKQKEKFQIKLETRLQGCGFRIDRELLPVNLEDIKQRLQLAFPGEELTRTPDLLHNSNLFQPA